MHSYQLSQEQDGPGQQVRHSRSARHPLHPPRPPARPPPAPSSFLLASMEATIGHQDERKKSDGKSPKRIIFSREHSCGGHWFDSRFRPPKRAEANQQFQEAVRLLAI